MTSSKISSAPTRSHSARSPSRKPVLGRHQAHVGGDRLDDHARRVGVELGHLVVGRDDRVGDRGVGDAGRAGEAEGGQAAARLGEQQVAVAVVVAGELHDLAPAGVAAGDADGRHRGLGARGHQPDQLDRRHALADRLGEQDLPLGRCAVGGAVDGRALHGLDDGRVGVAGDDGAVGLHEVEVARALDVPDVGALGAGDEVGRAADALEGADGAVHARRG